MYKNVESEIINQYIDKFNLSEYVFNLNSCSDKDVDIVGGKAKNLGIMDRSGLNIPSGFCISYNFFAKNDPVLLGRLKAFIENTFFTLNGKIAVRSSANFEDNTEVSLAGLFETIYVYEVDDIEKSLQKVYEQSKSQSVKIALETHGVDHANLKMSVIIQKLITPDIAGVAYTGVNDGKMLVQYVSDFGDKLVDGNNNGSTILINPKTMIIEDSSNYDLLKMSEVNIKSLIIQAKKLKKIDEYKDYNLDIEFAFDKNQLYLLQCRNLTRVINDLDLSESLGEITNKVKQKFLNLFKEEKLKYGTATSVYTNSNHIELLPKSKEMDVGIFQYIFSGTPKLYGAIHLGRLKMGYKINSLSRPITYHVGGKPYMSIVKDSLSYYIGVPDTIDNYINYFVSDYLNEIRKEPKRGIYPQMGLYQQSPTKDYLQNLFGRRSLKYYAKSKNFAVNIGKQAESFLDEFNKDLLPEMLSHIETQRSTNLNDKNVSELSEILFYYLEHLRTKSCVYFVQTARLGFYYSQKIKDELERQSFSSEKVNELLTTLLQGLEGSMFTKVNVQISESKNNEEAIELAEKLIGHYSTGEMLEIHHPRLSDNRVMLNSYVENIRRNNYIEIFNKQIQKRKFLEKSLISSNQNKFESVIKKAQKYMALRETVKYYFTIEYKYIREVLKRISEFINFKDQEIYHFYPWEIKKLLKKPEKYRHIYKYRSRLYQAYPKILMPPVITEDNVDSISIKSDIFDDLRELNGVLISQADDTIKGVIIKDEELLDIVQLNNKIHKIKMTGKKVILATTQLSLSHDPIIIQVDAMLLENAGIVSHGAQRARELGKGALGGIPVGLLVDGSEAEINFKDKKVTIISNKKTIY